MGSAASKDGVEIAYEKAGRGPAVLIVSGALSHRRFPGDQPLVARLADHFTVYTYDRRGRGESADASSYAVDREIEDIAALVEEAGGSAYVYGISSGAALALQAAAKLGATAITKLALYEPPYRSAGEKQKREFSLQKQRVNELINTGQPGEAVAFFLSAVGTPPEAIEGIKASPNWETMKKLEPTLAYDFVVMGDGTLPPDLPKAVGAPALVMDGENTMEFMHATADTLATFLPHAERKTLKGQTHQVAADALAPVLIEFFKRGRK